MQPASDGDGPPPPSFPTGLELAEARRRLAAIVASFLSQREGERQRRRPRTCTELLREGVPVLALLLVALGRLLSPGARTEDSEWLPFWASLGALGVGVMLNSWLASAQQASRQEEVAVRLRRALRKYQAQWAAVEEGDAGAEHPWSSGPRSHCEETYPVYRSGRWVRLPSLVLVEDDLIALAAGDEAPATVEELDGGISGTGSGDKEEHGKQGGQQLLRRGSPVAFRPGARADFRHRSVLAADSPQLLQLSGDLRVFRVVDGGAPLRAFLDETVAAAENQPLSPSLFAKDMEVVESVSLVAMLSMIAALILLAGLRFTWQDREWRHGAWADYIFTEPARLALLALPVSRPLLLLLIEALGTARLLVVLEALERGSGRAPSEDPALRPELDVEQRLSLRSVAPRVSRRRFLRYTAAVLQARLFKGLSPGAGAPRRAPGAVRGAAPTSQGGHHQQQQHVMLEMADMVSPQDEEQEQELLMTGRELGQGRQRRGNERTYVRKARAGPLLPIPMSRSGVLQRLGGVTFLSVVNDELVCRDAPIPQEVLFLNARKGKDKSPDPNKGVEAVSATVLRLAPDASAPSRLKFEHAQWVKHMAQLKPIGLNCLLVPAPHGGANGGNTKDAAAAAGEALVAYVLKGRRGRGLRGVGQEIGFCDADVAPFRELAQVHVISPSLAAQAAGDVRTQSPEERRGRGGLQPHLTGVVLEDGRQPGGMLQLLSQGAPTVVLPWCSEFFDGATLSRLTPDARALILETFCRRWALDDFNVTALSYTPVPPALRSQLRMAGGLTAGAVGRAPVPIYLVDGLSQQRQKHGRLDAIQEQSMLESAARLVEQLRAEEGKPRLGLALGSESDMLSEPRSASSGGTETPSSFSRVSTPGLGARHQQQQQQQQQQRRRHPHDHMPPAKKRSPHLSLLAPHLSMSMPDLNRASTVPPASSTSVAVTPTRAHVRSARDRSSGSSEKEVAPPMPLSLASTDDLQASLSLRPSLFSSSSSSSFYARGSLHAQEHGALWSLLHRQVFLGLVATVVQPTREAPPLVEELLAAGVRFTLFSPRTMRRTKALAEALGLTMDWNCALSLRPLDSDAPDDEHRLISEYGDVVRNARLPYGIPAIRAHIEQVDNVPLLVSIFTDATPGTADEMVGIMQENHESVLCVGAWRASNAPIFRHADVAIAVMETGDVARSSPVAADRRFAAELVGLPCAFRLGLGQQADGEGLAPLMDLIQEGRRLLACLYQMAALAVSVLTMASLMILAPRAIIPFPVLATFSLADVLWIVWVVVPLLILPLFCTPADLAVATRCARKGGEVATPQRVHYLACVPTVMACVYVQCRGTADLLLDVPDVLAACGLPVTARWRILQCPSLPRADIGGQSLAAITLAKDLALTAFVCANVVHSMSFLHRTASLGRESPFKNRVWPWTSLLLLLLQAAHLVLRAAAREDGLAALAALDWDVWTMMALGPLGALVIGEGLVKPMDTLVATRAARFRRLAFDTRLGTHSPK